MVNSRKTGQNIRRHYKATTVSFLREQLKSANIYNKSSACLSAYESSNTLASHQSVPIYIALLALQKKPKLADQRPSLRKSATKNTDTYPLATKQLECNIFINDFVMEVHTEPEELALEMKNLVDLILIP
ncbi:hypothetical protein NPIL_653811 [Nephila pilipes]|uniref:Uncharacterized protein n=1 Tax=Nephila pilipes TaxID=299642 RepID=A0A8X6NNW5_NEPPI|nr:hypothetical protein NPIL_653811 [Nephila pilipes]